MRALGVVLALGGAAHAEDDAVFVSAGLTAGEAIHATLPNGGVVGGELSVGVFGMHDKRDGGGGPAVLDLSRTPYWFGGYADIVRDFGSHTTRVTFGPELGRSYVGLDGGLLVDFGESTRAGASVRGVVSLAVIAVYVRYGVYFDDRSVDAQFVELGVLLKAPARVHKLRGD